MGLGIKEEMAALDGKDRKFYENLSEEDRKKFSTFMMIRWGALVNGGYELQEYYLIATNERLNKHYFDVPKAHDKINWLAATTISPGFGNQSHQWLSGPKKFTGDTKLEKFIAKQFPEMKPDEVVLFAKLNDVKTMKEYAANLGMAPDQIKKELG